MGLDMFLFRCNDDMSPKKDENDSVIDIAYWRNAHAISCWMNEHFQHRLSYTSFIIKKEQLRELFNLAQKALDGDENAKKELYLSHGDPSRYDYEMEVTVPQLKRVLNQYDNDEQFIYAEY